MLVKNTLNTMQNLSKKKSEIVCFLYGYREFFCSKFVNLTDEKVMVNSLSNMVSLNSELTDFVYLIFKNLGDKVIQKSLRIYLKNISDDKAAVLNLCDHMIYWKEMNFTKTGSDREKFSLDFLILKQLDTCFEELELDKNILQKLS